MKTSKHYLLLIYFVFFCNLSFSQWSQVGQLPQLGFARISVVDSNVVWATGDFTATPVLYRSVDGGINWTSIPTTGLPYFLTCLAAKDSLTAFVADVGSNNYAGGNAKIFKTSNAGQNWILIDSTGGAVGFFNDIVFSKSNPQIGIALSDPPNGAGNPFYLYKTTNGGVDWILTNPPGITSSYGLLNAAFAIDSQFYGFQIVNINSVTCDSYITSDGGINWYTGGETIPLFNYGFGEDIVFNDDKLTGIMISIDYLPNIKRTTDGGVSWETVNTLADISGFCNASWVSGTNTVFICAQTSVSNSNILRSDDGGLTWVSQNTAPVQNIKEIDNIRYDNIVIAYSVSSTGQILKSRQTIQIVPVELTSFSGSSVDGNIILNWSTASEINNRIFEVERREENLSFITIGYVEGKGTTTEQQQYSFVDKNISAGKYFYRLKQIDFDGTFEYSNEIEVDAAVPLSFSLEQNYPNPFNPSTKINYSIPHKSFVTLKVYDPLGSIVSELVGEEKEAGRYEVDFSAKGGSASGGNAVDLSSGVYFYKIEAGDFSEIKKMVLLR